MTVTVAGSYPQRAQAGTWTTFADPAAGSGWTVTVPAGQAWRIHGGSCQIVCSSTTGTRVPFVTVSNGSGIYAYVQYNRQNNTDFGPGANSIAQVVYNDADALLPTSFTSLPYAIGIPFQWWPAGTVIQGGFDNIKTGDQVSQVGFLIEEVTP